MDNSPEPQNSSPELQSNNRRVDSSPVALQFDPQHEVPAGTPPPVLQSDSEEEIEENPRSEHQADEPERDDTLPALPAQTSPELPARSSASSSMAGRWAAWAGLAAAAWVGLASGAATSSLSLYKDNLDALPGVDISGLPLMILVADNFGLVAGVLASGFSTPPWVLMVVGAVCTFSGFGVVWLAVNATHSIFAKPWVVYTALFVGANSSSWLRVALLMVNMQNFPLDRPAIAGMLNRYGVLGALFLMLLQDMKLVKPGVGHLLTFAIGIPAMCTIALCFMKTGVAHSGQQVDREGGFIMWTSFTAFGAIICFFLGAVPGGGKFGWGNVTLAAIGILLLLAPVAIATILRLSDGAMSPSLTVQGLEEPLLANTSGERGTRSRSICATLQDLLEEVLKGRFWLLFLSFALGVGASSAFLRIATVLKVCSEEMIKTAQYYFMFGNFVGRIAGGVISQRFLKSKPRTVLMAGAQVLIGLIYVFLAILSFSGASGGEPSEAKSKISHVLLWIALPLGICHGAHFSVVLPMTLAWSGLEKFPMLFSLVSLAIPGSASVSFYSIKHSTLADVSKVGYFFIVLLVASVVGAGLSSYISQGAELSGAELVPIAGSGVEQG